MTIREANGGCHLHLDRDTKYLPETLTATSLPFPASSVDSIYSTHVLEHFYPDEAEPAAAGMRARAEFGNRVAAIG
jgi:hypothetical protein